MDDREDFLVDEEVCTCLSLGSFTTKHTTLIQTHTHDAQAEHDAFFSGEGVVDAPAEDLLKVLMLETA